MIIWKSIFFKKVVQNWGIGSGYWLCSLLLVGESNECAEERDRVMMMYYGTAVTET